jgi:hypothetical protein
LNQVPDSAEQSDVKRYREDSPKPTFDGFVRQDHRPGRDIVHGLHYP